MFAFLQSMISSTDLRDSERNQIYDLAIEHIPQLVEIDKLVWRERTRPHS